MKQSKAFLAVFKDTIRRFIPLSIAYWVILALANPIDNGWQKYLIDLSNTTNHSTLISVVQEYIGVELIVSVFNIALAMLFGIITTFIACAYMHNKRSMDYHVSQPITRQTQLFARITAVVAITIIPLFLFTVAGSSVFGFEGFSAVMKLSARGAVVIIANIIMITLMAVCCGTVIHSVISYGLISVIYPICVFLVYSIIGMSLPGKDMGNIDSMVFVLLSPIFAPISMIISTDIIDGNKILNGTLTSNAGEVWFYYIWWIVFIVGISVLAYFLVKKRKTETAQSGFAFIVPNIVIKFFTSITVGLLAGILVSTVSGAIASEYGGNVTSLFFVLTFIVGLVIGVCVCHTILHLIYSRGATGFVKYMPLCGAELIVGIVFYLLLTTNVFGIVTNVPKADEVESVSISFSDMRGEVTIDGENPYMYTTSDEDEIRAIVDYHQAVVYDISRKTGDLYTVNNNYFIYDIADAEYMEADYENDENVYAFYVEYTTKSGDKIVREYGDDYIYILSENISILDSYKEKFGVYDTSLYLDIDDCVGVYVEQDSYNKSDESYEAFKYYAIEKPEDIKKLYKAVVEDSEEYELDDDFEGDSYIVVFQYATDNNGKYTDYKEIFEDDDFEKSLRVLSIVDKKEIQESRYYLETEDEF